MRPNVGYVDRLVRVLAGGLLLTASAFLAGPWALLCVPGLFLFLSGTVGTCPFYLPFGFDTLSSRDMEDSLEWDHGAMSERRRQ